LHACFQVISQPQETSNVVVLGWSPSWTDILDPEVPVVCFSYSEGRSGQSNRFESQAVASLIWLLREAGPLQQLANEVGMSAPLPGTHTFDTFWKRGVGVVTPHSAQKSMIVEDLKRAFGATFAQSRVIRDAVDTVEKLQGQQRDVIVASFAIGDPDIVAQEQEFLFMLQRFNVMASRPRAKLIVFVTDDILDYVSDDNDVLENSRAIKLFARTFCRNPRRLTLPWRDRSGVSRSVTGDIRSVI
jgi:DNA replication ATP-dependent helicase Dna2